MADVEIRSDYLGVNGGHIRGFNNHGLQPVVSADREISEDDVQDVIKNAKAINLPAQNHVVHAIRQNFLVDGQDGIENPVGMFGARVEVDVHVVHGNFNRLQNPIRTVKTLQLEVEAIVFNGLASALALLTPEQKELGALVIDISGLSNLARGGFVQAIIELVKDLCQWEIEHDTHRFPFIFFEEAHLYVSPQSIDYIVTRARHLGITSFFVTNMIQGLDEAILRQADNLFLLRIPYEDDVRHVSRGAATDFATMDALVRRLRQRHALVVGNVTSQYPLMFEVDPLRNVNTAGETRFFFRGKENGS